MDESDKWTVNVLEVSFGVWEVRVECPQESYRARGPSGKEAFVRLLELHRANLPAHLHAFQVEEPKKGVL